MNLHISVYSHSSFRQAVPGPRSIRVPARPRGLGGGRDRRAAHFGTAHGRGLLLRGEREDHQAQVAAHRALPHQSRVRDRHRVAGGGTDVSDGRSSVKRTGR